MPSTLPARFFIQHVKQMAYTAIRWILRACLVSFIWLGIVPYITIWTWRVYFCIADVTSRLFHLLFFHKYRVTRTSERKSILDSIFYDCFQGWIIDLAVIVLFIAGFLLREWMLQNVPTELHDEEQEEQDLQAHEQILVDHPIVQPIHLEQEPIVEYFNEDTYIRRDRVYHARRPSLLQGPSDYENIEAIWLMDQGQASPPRRDLTDLDQRVNLENEYDLDESEEEDYGNPRNSERVQEILESIRREHRFAREEQRINNNNGIAQPPPLNNERVEHPADERPREGGQDANINDGIEEMDGVLEAIGMRGSINMLLQNSGLMTLLISLCLAVGVCLPYVLGVFFIAVSFWMIL